MPTRKKLKRTRQKKPSNSYISSSSAPSSSGNDSDDEKTDAPVSKTTKARSLLEDQHPQYTLVGVTVLAEGQHADRNAEMIRLLRMRRYFDDDFEENTKRCFKCGGAGHMARDCTNAPRLRSCYLCAEFGHDGRDCPNQLCWRCQRTGHQSRDCPFVQQNGGAGGGGGAGNRKRVRTWDEEDNPTVCLKCGRTECPCAGYGDYARAEGGCTNSYKNKDLEKVRCFVCGHKGHLACTKTIESTGVTTTVVVVQALPPPMPKPSCYNCGEGGHTAEKCWKEKPVPMRAERDRDRNERRPSGGVSGGRYAYSGGDRDRDVDRYDGYQSRHYQQERHQEYREQQRHSYSGSGGGGGGGGFRSNNRGGGGGYSGGYSQEKRGRYSEYNEDSRKRRRYDDKEEDRSYAAGNNGGGGGGDDSYRWKVHSNAYGALEYSEYDGGGGDFYETPPQQGYRNKKGNQMHNDNDNKKSREKSRFSNGSGGGSMSNTRRR